MTPIEKARTAGFLFITLYSIFKTNENEESESGEWADQVAAEKAIDLALKLMTSANSLCISKRPNYGPGKF